MTALTPDQLDRMRQLWEGSPELSAVQIGALFGVSANSVIGRAHRSGWGMRGKPTGKDPTTLPQRRLAALNLFPGRGCCVFPIGHPEQADFRFCGEAVPLPGAPYCRDHLKVCYVGASQKKDALRGIKAAAKSGGFAR